MQLVDELEALVSKSFRFPFSSVIIVNEDELFDILDQMRIAIPKEIKEAKRTEAERERILSRAQEEANRLVGMGKEKMMTAVDDHEIALAARNRADEIIEQAKRESLQIQIESNNYVAEHLSTLEEQLLKLLTTVRNGLRTVQSTHPEMPDNAPTGPNTPTPPD
jgi:cell division septum initiation protein DivIVA